MARELILRQRPDAKELCLLFKKSTKEINPPIIIAAKGHVYEGKKLVAFALAAAFDCLLINEDNMCVTSVANELKQGKYREYSQIALSQLQIGLSVVIDCDPSQESEFFILQDFAIATETPLFIFECKPCNEEGLESFHSNINLCPDYAYDVGNTQKLFVNVTNSTFDDTKKFMPRILQSISAYCKEWMKVHTKIPSCYSHHLGMGSSCDVSENGICNRCSKQLANSILKCNKCSLVIHKTCSELPLRISLSRCNLTLENYGDGNDKVRCGCCDELVKGYAYKLSGADYSLCLDCLFTSWTLDIKLHEHRLSLEFSNDVFECDACGSVCKQKLRYECSVCKFEIGVKCGWLKETVWFDRHRHPFHLDVSPEHYSNQYYCDVCEKERDKKHWVYCCIGCEFFIHVRCLVPTGGCPPSEPCDYELYRYALKLRAGAREEYRKLVDRHRQV